jgi:hypothetical protein
MRARAKQSIAIIERPRVGTEELPVRELTKPFGREEVRRREVRMGGRCLGEVGCNVMSAPGPVRAPVRELG